MSKFLEKVAEVANREETEKFRPSYVRAGGRAAVGGIVGNILLGLPGALLGSRSISTAGALAGTALGAYDGWHDSIDNQRRERAQHLKKASTLDSLVNAGIDFDEACDHIEKQAKEKEEILRGRDVGHGVGTLVGLPFALNRVVNTSKIPLPKAKVGVVGEFAKRVAHNLAPMYAGAGAGYALGKTFEKKKYYKE